MDRLLGDMSAIPRVLAGPAMIVGASLLTVGCNSQIGDGASQITERDSAGIRIVTTHGSFAEPELWEVGLHPLLEMGCSDGPSEYMFNRITGLRFDRGKMILVADHSNPALRMFDTSGRLVEALGNRGRGPGEFVRPYLVESPGQSDSVYVWDSRVSELTVFAHTRSGLRYVGRRRLIGLPGLPSGVIGRRVVSSGTVLTPANGGLASLPAEFWLHDRVSGTTDRFGDFPGRKILEETELSPVPAMINIPFDIMPSLAAGRKEIYVTPGEGPEIHVYTPHGELQRILRVGGYTDMVKQEEMARVADYYAAQSSNPSAIKKLYMDLPLPDVRPAFQRLILDSQDWLWAGRFEPLVDWPRSWVVFDTGGVARGTVNTPSHLDVHYIGEDFILGVTRDQMGVERTALYALDRGAPFQSGNEDVSSSTPPPSEQAVPARGPCVQRFQVD